MLKPMKDPAVQLEGGEGAPPEPGHKSLAGKAFEQRIGQQLQLAIPVLAEEVELKSLVQSGPGTEKWIGGKRCGLNPSC